MRAGCRGKSDERAPARVPREQTRRCREREQDEPSAVGPMELRQAVDHEMTSGVLEQLEPVWEPHGEGCRQAGRAQLMQGRSEQPVETTTHERAEELEVRVERHVERLKETTMDVQQRLGAVDRHGMELDGMTCQAAHHSRKALVVVAGVGEGTREQLQVQGGAVRQVQPLHQPEAVRLRRLYRV